MNSENLEVFVPRPSPRQRTDGQKSRETILRAAAQLATTRGLAGLSIGALAEFIGMSKSGLFAHFGSKEELELATIETAVEIFAGDVLKPALRAGPGLAGLLALTDAFLSHLERRVFPGGCFFAAVAAELDTRPGKARDRVLELQREWMDLHARCLREAQEAGEIDARADLPQVLFEVEAMLIAANFSFVMNSDPRLLRQARRGVENVLARVRPKAKPRGGRSPRRSVPAPKRT
jgi:AcrR family transcriptional regulator